MAECALSARENSQLKGHDSLALFERDSFDRSMGGQHEMHTRHLGEGKAHAQCDSEDAETVINRGIDGLVVG